MWARSDHPRQEEILAVFIENTNAMIDDLCEQVARKSPDGNRKLTEGKNRRADSVSIITQLENSGTEKRTNLDVSMAYFPLENGLKNLTTNSKYPFIAVCECSAAPFPHPFQLITNTNKGTCGHQVAKSPFITYTKSVLFRHPGLLAECVPADVTRLSMTVESNCRDKFTFECQSCRKPYETSAYSKSISTVCSECQTGMRNKGKVDKSIGNRVSDSPFSHQYSLKNPRSAESVSMESGEKAIWDCVYCKREYKCEPRKRTKVSNCQCVSKISAIQFMLFSGIKEISERFDGTIVRLEDRLTDSKNKNIDTSVLINEVKIAIEYDGEYHHKEHKLSTDIRLSEDIIRKGYHLIRIRPKSLPKIEIGKSFLNRFSLIPIEYNDKTPLIDQCREIFDRMKDCQTIPDSFRALLEGAFPEDAIINRHNDYIKNFAESQMLYPLTGESVVNEYPMFGYFWSTHNKVPAEMIRKGSAFGCSYNTKGDFYMPCKCNNGEGAILKDRLISNMINKHFKTGFYKCLACNTVIDLQHQPGQDSVPI